MDFRKSRKNPHKFPCMFSVGLVVFAAPTTNFSRPSKRQQEDQKTKKAS